MYTCTPHVSILSRDVCLGVKAIPRACVWKTFDCPNPLFLKPHPFKLGIMNVIIGPIVCVCIIVVRQPPPLYLVSGRDTGEAGGLDPPPHFIKHGG